MTAQLGAGDRFGQYDIVRLLGRGGMGEVYEARHRVLKRPYALKLLPAGFLDHKGALERFQREAEVMAHLVHPNIIHVDDFGETEGRYWLRMELAEGINKNENKCISLQELADAGGGRIEPDLLLTVIDQILSGLAYAHQQGVVHRDLKPSNILMRQNPGAGKQEPSLQAKISDFGLVRLVGEGWLSSQAQLTVQHTISLGDQQTEALGTSTRALLGTYEYMSPEQKDFGEADERSDIYSFGLLTYQLLTGRRLTGFPKPPSKIVEGLDSRWDEVVTGCLEADPEDRPGSAEEVSEAFAPLRQGAPTSGQDVRPGPSAEPDPVPRVVSGAFSPDPGERWRIPDLGMEFLPIGRGSFKMGSDDGDSSKDEKPVHTVRMGCDFWLGKTEVTQSEYAAVMGKNPSSFKGDKNPVDTVSWNDAVAFCGKLTDREQAEGRIPEGWAYRLPTEAEWEYAARGGAKSKGFKYAGSNKPGDVAWFAENSGKQTHPAGRKRANELGLHDMSGNVWEWCEDFYVDSYQGTPTDGRAQISGGSSRVKRGGSWGSSAKGVRSANRGGGPPSDTYHNLGFRVCLGRSR